MAKVDLKHSGAVIDQQIDRMLDGSVVVENTLSALDLESKKPVDSQGIASAIETASNSLKQRGYIYMGVATPTTTPDVSGGKVFYLAATAGEYTNFGYTLPTDVLTSLEWDGERWFAIRIADLVTPAEVVQAILDNTATKIEKGEAKPVASEVVAEALEAIDKQLENKAGKTEYYPEMAVGIADNLRGRGEATEEIFTYRPSAGASDSIAEEGVATIERIKGNTVVWNQRFLKKWASFNDVLKVENDDGSTLFELTGASSYIDNPLEFIVGHKYLISFLAKRNNEDHSVQVRTYGYTPIFQVEVQTTSYVRFCAIVTAIDSDYHILRATGDQGGSLTVDKEQYIDLTEMFGAGNEPTTVEEFYERIPIGIDPYAYNEGELLSENVESIVTNGFNQWDEQWELGGIAINSGINYGDDTRIRSKNYNLAIPNAMYYFRILEGLSRIIFWYDSEYNFIRYSYYIGNSVHTSPSNARYFKILLFETYGTTYKNDICINLSHSGVRDGEYEPYEEHTKDLAEIARYFPDGMKSVGEVFDEINEHEAVQRVGQRAYAEGDNDNPVVMTDGVNTIYPLDTPIVTPMPTRAINLNYSVWDWGTERAVSDVPSAPFRADIIYGFNAVDTIRTNKLAIEELMQRVAELEAKSAGTSAATMEEEIL